MKEKTLFDQIEDIFYKQNPDFDTHVPDIKNIEPQNRNQIFQTALEFSNLDIFCVAELLTTYYATCKKAMGNQTANPHDLEVIIAVCRELEDEYNIHTTNIVQMSVNTNVAPHHYSKVPATNIFSFEYNKKEKPTNT